MSGRRKHPTPPPAGSLTALAGRLSDGDRQVCRLLAEHQVLTTGLLAVLLDVPSRTLQQRLATLTSLRMVDRFRPRQPVGAGSAPYHYLLTETGAAILAADPTTTDGSLGRDRGQLLRLVQANGRLSHLLGVNTLLAQLTHTARHEPGARLVCWWPAHRCHTQWGRLIGPDAYARWQDPCGEVDFFLHYQPAAEQPAGLLDGYNDLAVATGITTPVLLHAPDPDQETRLRRALAGQRLLVPVATANPGCGPPTTAVWLPASSPAAGRRYRLGALGHPDPWQPPHPPGPRTVLAQRPTPSRARLVDGTAGWR